jgi:hypothetical protein
MKICALTKPAWIVAAMCVTLGFSACDDGTPDYFPLESGTVWIYRQTVVIENHGNSGGRKTQKLVAAATDLPPRRNGDENLNPRIFADGRMLYFEKASDGVVLVGARRAFEDTIEPIAPRYVIKRPIEEGTTWQENLESQILQRSFLGTFGTISKPVEVEGEMRFKIESLDDTVRVPVGTFHRCLRVHGTGEASLQWGEPFGTLQVTVTTTEWFAPSVGLVKRVREESTGRNGPLGARLEEELAAKRDGGWFH